MKKGINELLNIGDIEGALHVAAGSKDGGKLILADYLNEKWLFEHGIITNEAFCIYEQQVIASIPNLYDDIPDPPEPEAAVFLSYNRSDYKEALMIKERLALHNIKVHIDQLDVNPGESIKEFIHRQTSDNKAVMLLISERSLTSAWVSYEMITAIFNNYLNHKKIIPLTLDDKFMDDNFSLLAHKEFDRMIQEKCNSIEEHKKNGISDIRHLETDKQRLFDARNRLSDIFKKLRGIAVHSLTGENIDVTFDKIIKMLLK